MARQFGASWWGRAWIDAVENRASLDPNRLPRGRTYARHGHVESLECEPGSIRALVSGSRNRPYRVEIRFRTFDDDEWTRLLNVIVARAERTAALLDGELDPDLVEDAATAGINLLPHAGELQPRCSCPDRADPCKHSAAVCYLVADELDNDPFVLLSLRGRDRERILSGVRRLRSGRPGQSKPGDGHVAVGGRSDAGIDRGVRASEAWASPIGSLPSVPAPRLHPGRSSVVAVDPPSQAPFTAEGLEALVTDSAIRAWSALTGEPELHLDLASHHDLVRLAASTMAPDQLQHLAAQNGTTRRALARRAIAWRVGAAAGLAALDEPPWRPQPLTMAAARQVLTESGAATAGVKIERNRITMDNMQLRLSRRGTWWRFVKRGNAWELDAGPGLDVDELL